MVAITGRTIGGFTEPVEGDAPVRAPLDAAEGRKRDAEASADGDRVGELPVQAAVERVRARARRRR
jgi:hypothetical protein